VTPVSPLEADADYLIRARDACAADGATEAPRAYAAFHTGLAAALPTTLGEIAEPELQVGTLHVFTSSGSCTSPIIAATANLSLTLSADAAPWEPALEITTLVDGVRWTGSSTVLYAPCSSTDPGTSPGLSEGQHHVVMRGTLPGYDGAIESDPVLVTLACASSTDSPDRSSACSTDGAGRGDHRQASYCWSVLGAAAALCALRRARGAAIPLR
jgi:hypothetical protein